jgi:hypothetical protein
VSDKKVVILDGCGVHDEDLAPLLSGLSEVLVAPAFRAAFADLKVGARFKLRHYQRAR